MLKAIEGINVSHLTTTAPQIVSITSPPSTTVIRVKLGGTVYLPCQCGGWNVGSNIPPKWENSRGEDLLLTTPGDDIVHRKQRKYILYNDVKWLKTRGDFSLVLRNVTWEDQGEYTCTYLEPEFKFVPYQNDWIKEVGNRIISMVWGDILGFCERNHKRPQADVAKTGHGS
uniref:Ig-like domain-containing protein n=1 Tax=Cyclopterus lumpus TaxID=8103 RepID=A0A8C2XCY5_CYCLU